jgi:hypothetical protein
LQAVFKGKAAKDPFVATQLKPFQVVIPLQSQAYRMPMMGKHEHQFSTRKDPLASAMVGVVSCHA